MDQQQFEKDVTLALYYLFDWIQKKQRWDLFQNLPERFQKSKQLKEIAERLYNIYAFDFSFYHKVNDPVEQVLVQNISEEINFFKAALHQAASICSERSKQNLCAKPFTSQDQGWIFTGPKGSETLDSNQLKRRIYVNVKTQYIPNFIEDILKEFQRYSYEVRFKFTNPFAANELDLMRPETIVFYFTEEADIRNFIKFLSQKQKYFNNEVALFTQKLMPGVSYAPHITQEIQKYLDCPTNSYGDTITQITARSLLSFIINFQRIPQPEEFPKIAHSVYEIVHVQAFSS